MHRYIYISTEGKNEHERVCATAGHAEHSDVYLDNQWRPAQ